MLSVHEQRLKTLELVTVGLCSTSSTPLHFLLNQLVGSLRTLLTKSVCSLDFPHVEGGRNPLRRFDNEVAALSDETQDRFFRTILKI